MGVGALILSNGKILLEKRLNEPGRGKWSIPGGLVELGESPEDAVIREVREETGLIVADPKLVGVVNSVTLDADGRIKYHFVIIDYFVRVLGGELRAADDAEAVRWVNLDKAEEYDLTETLRQFLRRNFERLKGLNSFAMPV